MSSKKNKTIIRSSITMVIVVMLAIYFIFICWKGLKQMYVEDGWLVTTGTIMDPDATILGKKNVDRKTQGIEQTINYEYTVDGIKYESNSVSRELFVDKKDYPKGKIVDVYYNPNNFADTVLIRTKVQTQYLYGMIGCCLLVICVTIFFWSRDIKYAK